jgi:tetratricopeptide (TPR) repeat protein
MRRVAISSFLAAGLLAGCAAAPETDVREAIAQAWEDFASGSWAEARDGFQHATGKEPDNVEAWTGLGWSLARLGDLPEARVAFTTTRDLRPAAAQAYAGAAVVEHAWAGRPMSSASLGLTISLADSALAISPGFVFEHDTRVTWEDLRLIIAQSAYTLGDYDRVLVEIENLGGDVPNPASPTLAQDILNELEVLFARIGGDGAVEASLQGGSHS